MERLSAAFLLQVMGLGLPFNSSNKNRRCFLFPVRDSALSEEQSEPMSVGSLEESQWLDGDMGSGWVQNAGGVPQSRSPSYWCPS